MKKTLLFFLLLTTSCLSLLAFDKNSAYISHYAQRTELVTKDENIFTRVKYEIVFKFNDERAIQLFHSYAIFYSYFDKLENLEVYTKNPDKNGKFKKIEIKNFKTSNASASYVFYDDQTQVDIDFLGLTIGSEAYVNYTVTTEELHYTDPMTFRYYMPIEHMEYELTVPENVNISFIEKNIPPNFYQYSKQDKKNETIHKWVVENIEADKSYERAPSSLYYIPHVLYKVNNYTYKSKSISVSNSPQDLYDWYMDKAKDVNKNKSEKLKVLADSITKGATTEVEKVRRVYNWVKSNIRYVAFEAGLTGLVPREAEAVCSKRYGDCKDMGSIQYGLLKELNIPAHLVSIGTRSIPYTYSEVPLKNTDNHMIAAYKNGNEWIFLDATDPNGTFGLPADHIQGKQAMIHIDEKKYELAMVPVVNAKTNTMTETCTFIIQNDNTIEINTVSNYRGLFVGNLANQLHYLTESEKEDFAKAIIKNVSNNALLNKYNIPSFTAEDSVAKIEMKYTIKDFVKEVGNEKYINIFLDKLYMNSAITEENRTVPYSFGLNLNNVNTYVLTIPLGYKVSYKPEDVNIKNDNFGVEIKYNIEGDKLICYHSIFSDFPTLLMDYKQFPAWNNFVNKLNKAYKENIILEKIK